MQTFHDRPHRSITVRTYEELDSWFNGFVGGLFSLMFLIGRPGIGKTQKAIQSLKDRPHAWIDCHATKMSVYIKLFQNRDKPVVIDDENSMMADSGKLGLLNALCQTNPVKTLRWDSTTRLLDEWSVPAEFQTSSQVLIVTNRIRVVGPQMRAMIDRGLPLVFQPSAATVHAAVADWFTDREIHDFIGKWLPLIPGLSMRDYVKSREIKNAGMDWRGLLHRQWKSGKFARVAALRADPSFPSEEDRVRLFVAERTGSRAGYFRCVQKLRDLGVIPVREERTETILASTS